MRAHHFLKCDPTPFDGLWRKLKAYEVRLDDRKYSVGDVLHLFEHDPVTNQATGRQVTARITYKTSGGQYGLPTTLCVLGILELGRTAGGSR